MASSINQRLNAASGDSQLVRELQATLQDMRLDLVALAAAVTAMAAQLDADAGVTDTDYEATHGLTITNITE